MAKQTSKHNRYWQAKRVTVIGAFVNAVLGVLKLAGGFLYQSHALFADGVHSFADLFADVMVLFASKYGSLDADESHPYGHQRIETAATLGLSLFLIITGSGIAWDALEDIFFGLHSVPKWFTIPIVCISILANELSFQYTRYIGKRIKSPLILANAWHHRSDAGASVVVLLALIGSLLGFAYLDAVGATIVGIMIIKMGWDYAWNSVKELVDTAVHPELLSEIERVIKTVDGVEKIHQLRSRSMGGDVLIDVHVLVSPKISVSEGHYIAQHVHQTLLNQIESIKDVTVHIDPEDDEISSPSMHLPSRAILRNFLLKQVHIDFPQILFWNLHYLDGKIIIDIACPEDFTQWKALHERVIQALKIKNDIAEVRLFALHETMYHSQ